MTMKRINESLAAAEAILHKYAPAGSNKTKISKGTRLLLKQTMLLKMDLKEQMKAKL